ncbi:hypothetical protein VTI28DRAFT_4301 [Corynascus sepedonium]
MPGSSCLGAMSKAFLGHAVLVAAPGIQPGRGLPLLLSCEAVKWHAVGAIVGDSNSFMNHGIKSRDGPMIDRFLDQKPLSLQRGPAPNCTPQIGQDMAVHEAQRVRDKRINGNTQRKSGNGSTLNLLRRPRSCTVSGHPIPSHYTICCKCSAVVCSIPSARLTAFQLS